MNNKENIGILGLGVYLPEPIMTAKQISEATQGYWTEEAVREKLGINKKHIPGEKDGTQAMGVWAAQKAIDDAGINPKEIDLVLSIGEEYKEYPLTTTSIYIQEKIGARNAWAIDVQQRCGTAISAMKMAKDMMISDDEIKTVLIAGGYRNGDFIDYSDQKVSFMYNLGAGGGAMVLKKGMSKNLLLGTHILTDGSLARDVGVEFGGTENPINDQNYLEAARSLRVFNEAHMRERLNEVSMINWMYCINRAFEKSGIDKQELNYLATLHFKKSMHDYLLKELHLKQEQSIYLSDYGHIGQIDQILSLYLAREEGRLNEGSIIAMIAAGIGYAWNANVIRWG